MSELDLDIVHRFLSEHSNWARGIPRPLLERAIEHSTCFGGFIFFSTMPRRDRKAVRKR